MTSPYDSLPKTAFWRTGVAGSSPFNPVGLYAKKWPIPDAWKIATAGSCFAQHISRHLKQNGYNVLDMEPAPPGLPASMHTRYGYSMYSSRYGNIYTVHQLRQLLLEASGQEEPRDIVWRKDGRHYDALRPAVEPDGHESADEVMSHRAYHLGRVRKMLTSMDLLIFTLGLTEAWVNRDVGTVYPTAPGTIAGDFDPEIYSFRNYGFTEILAAFDDVQRLLAEIRGERGLPRFLLTVSPVPLTGTASGVHVLQATSNSKSILRAVAGELAGANDHIDYFPSYEVITNQAARGCFYEENLRSVRKEGVDAVMKVFFQEHSLGAKPAAHLAPASAASAVIDEPRRMPADLDAQCEEALIEAFAR